MSIVKQDIQNDLALAKQVLSEKDVSIVLVNNNKIWKEKKGPGIRPILELIDDMGDEISDYVVGDRILGRASAFLCSYGKAKAVYSPQATKTAIAILIINGIPCQVDEMIEFIKNRDGTGLCPFEKMLSDVEKPDEAYKILKEKIK